jgi:predicted thioesterase
MLSGSQTALVAETLRVSLLHAAATGESGAIAQSLTEAGAALPANGAAGLASHPALPAVGATVTRELVVAKEDTAAAMGHPDGSLDVLGSPRIALWFEIVASQLLPVPTAELTHVGVGILVHHLARAEVGESVTVEATVEAAAGRRVVFSCTATVGDRVVALGVHQRVVLEQR